MKKEKIEYGKKKKSVAVALSIFLGQWTWIYSYREDYWKFWMALVFNLLLGWTIIVFVAIWIWAIIDVGIRSKEWYTQYNK